MRDGMRRGGRLGAVMAVLLLCGCTLSNSLRQDDFYSVWRQGPATRTMFFATDREPAGGGFGLHWNAALRCGRAAIAIPVIWSSAPLPLAGNEACDTDAALAAFARQVAATAHDAGCGRVLVFVHGYNTTFRTAMAQAAQLSLDTQWRCAMLAFSWSSEAKFDRYAADIERSGFAVPALIGLVRELKAAGLEVDLLTHSMGGRVTLSALGALCAEPRTVVNDLLLVAADVGAEQGNDDFGHLLRRTAPCVRHVTVYASDNDMALIASESVHGGVPRAGRVPGRDRQYAGTQVDIVNASLAPGDSTGHGYLTLSYEMAEDVMWTLADTDAARRVQIGTLACADGCADARYVLKVAPERHPDGFSRLIRQVWPLIFPVQ
ncbi:MAG TPA: alpha/beta hydrolase [Rhizomicrobium sp.]